MSVARNAQLTPFTSSWRGPRTPCTPHQLRIAAEAGAIAARILQHQNPYAVGLPTACPERDAVWQAAYDTAGGHAPSRAAVHGGRAMNSSEYAAEPYEL